MNAALTALNGFLLALSWYAEQGTTYTVQTSGNLVDWMTLPFVFTGRDSIESLALEANPSPVFTRIRSNTNGDTNENGLPDVWEQQTFGRLDINASSDPDGDGLSTYIEWLNQTDPLDYYNGDQPSIHLSCGSEWLVRANQLSTQSLSLSLLDKTGRPIVGAPVCLRLQSGSDGLLQKGDPVSSAVPEMLAYTDDLGRLHPSLHAIHYAASTLPDQDEVLIIEAGKASAEIRIHVIPGEGNGPPRGIMRTVLANQTLFTWKGDAADALSFRVEEKASSGDWIPVLELTDQEIPDADPQTGLYAFSSTAP
ncbi:hypothetical protein G0Q06_03550 [Puniceicoccales bacterium CK1056]|uniref:Uncharacterized protein n=1 Tax=Oceanipulchritudo coccoides TaxID=2706888 RepID=A0A6B2LZP2_9BACT|nr:hypothetical protein [Oceanipulchritudo coccoides]NDV61519.1 hypothetical protein [Oceanipulchritudo coccoides]